VDPETAALLFLGLIQPAGVLWFLTDGEFDVTRHVQRAWKTLLRGIEEPAALPRRKAIRGRTGKKA
jgi:hypothetical protein